MADPDVDGDTLLDGEDDQDNDDYTNIREIYEVVYDLDGDGGFTCGVTTYPSIDTDPGAGNDPHGVNAFNPCAPDPHSRTVPRLEALRLTSSPLPAVPPPTWRPHPRS